MAQTGSHPVAFAKRYRGELFLPFAELLAAETARGDPVQRTTNTEHCA